MSILDLILDRERRRQEALLESQRKANAALSAQYSQLAESRSETNDDVQSRIADLLGETDLNIDLSGLADLNLMGNVAPGAVASDVTSSSDVTTNEDVTTPDVVTETGANFEERIVGNELRSFRQAIYSDGTLGDWNDVGFIRYVNDPSPSSSGPPQLPGTKEIPGDPVEKFDVREFAKLNYTWLNSELMETFLQAYNTNGGDAEEAIRLVRSTQAYKDEFPGIFRDDGVTLRIDTTTPELDYIKIKEDYNNYLEDYNLNPEYFEDKVTQLFENDVAPETFAQRLNVAYNSLFNQFDAVKTYYVENYPGTFPTVEDITDEAIFASFIDEDVSADIINQRVKVSQIGGAFKAQDFAVSTKQAQRLISAGLSGEGAQQLAARAETQLPRLQRLAKRFTGSEDIFGLSQFIESEVFGEGVSEQLRERLEAEQRTVFTREGGAARTQEGLTGLVEL